MGNDALCRQRFSRRPVPTVVAVVVLAVLLVACGDGSDRGPATGSTPTAAPATELPPTPPTAPGTVTVVRVVDGDTLDVSSGERVRLIGIDTPEVGECGDDEAAAVLATWSMGGR